ncbi:MAG: OmpH family outer membrane protein [Chitinophagales bacterium]|jgi:Skp family chaperone for outer membrane proteins|nr:OmpH family outer membrane protein [Chitinophagales bacterium]
MTRILISFLSFFILSNVLAQRTAFLDEELLLKATPGYSRAQREIDSIKKGYESEIKILRENLNKKVDLFLNENKIPKDVQVSSIPSLLQEKEKKKWDLLLEEAKLIDKQVKLKEEEYESIYLNKMGGLLNKVNDLVAKYCKENKIEVLYKLETMIKNLAYIDPKANVTSDIIKLIDKSFK